MDHGHFFAGGPAWDPSTLAAASSAEPDPGIVSAANLGPSALRPAIAALGALDDAMIATAVAAPPDSWGVSLDDRIALARYLAGRRDALTASFPPAG